MNADDCLAITRTLYTNGSVSINYNGTPFMPDDEEPRFYFGLFLPEAEHIKALLGYTILSLNRRKPPPSGGGCVLQRPVVLLLKRTKSC